MNGWILLFSYIDVITRKNVANFAVNNILKACRIIRWSNRIL